MLKSVEIFFQFNRKVLYIFQASNNSVDGIALLEANNSTIVDSVADSNSNGISLEKSNCSIIKNNSLNANWHGFIIKESHGDTIVGNRIQGNKIEGINLKYSTNNLIYLNDLIDNADRNALDDSANQWDNGTTGNHYSDFECADVDINGTCDSKYNVAGGSNVDRYTMAL
jgi:parallel beta-helix repeat protein